MSPVRRARTPRTPLYRIGRHPDPLAWPPWEYVGSGRFDYPTGEFRVLYATARRRAAFMEILARFRPSLVMLAALKAVGNSEEPLPRARVPADWYRARAVARLRLATRQRWLDLGSLETREAPRHDLAQTLLELGLEDLDLSGVVRSKRQFTQAIARWAYEHGNAGPPIAVGSMQLSCWAIFEGAAFGGVGLPEPILPDDPDQMSATRSFGIVV